MNDYFPFDQEPELSDDLEWMLQNRSAEPGMLAEALIKKYYQPVYQLALAVLDDPQAAFAILPDLFVVAIENRYRFSAIGSIEPWLLRVLVKPLEKRSQRTRRSPQLEQDHPVVVEEDLLWTCFAALPAQTRHLLLFRHLLGLEMEAAAQAAGLKSMQAQAALEFARQRCASAFNWGSGSGGAAGSESFNERLANALQRRWPDAPPLDQEQQARLIEEVTERAERASMGRQRSNFAKEVLAVLLVVLLIGSGVWGANVFFPEPTSSPTPTITRRPTITSVPTPTPVQPLYNQTTLPQNVFYTVQPGDSLVLIAMRLNTTVNELEQINRLQPGAPIQIGQSLLIPGAIDPRSTPLPGTPIPTLPPEPDLDQNSTYDQAVWKINSLVGISTIFLDYQMTYYGLPGSIVAPSSYRTQFWFQLDGAGFLMLAGKGSEAPSEAIILANESFAGAAIGQENPWFINPEMSDGEEYRGTLLPFRLMADVFSFGRENVPANCFRNLGEEQMNGATVVLFECLDPQQGIGHRFWMESKTGIPLRSQFFTENNRMISEITSYRHAFGGPFPWKLADPWLPWRGGFARNAAGDPEYYDPTTPTPLPTGTALLPLIDPPEDFNPASELLTFQYLDEPDWSDPSSTNGMVVQLFAGEYFLGEINFPDPHSVTCKRSPSGKLIAFVNASNPIFDEWSVSGTQLRWIDLTKPDRVNGFEMDLSVGEFVFSPDDRYLAFFNYNQSQISIIDLRTGDFSSFGNNIHASNLAWSPDGQYLVYVDDSQYSARENTSISIISARDQKVVYLTWLERDENGKLIIPADSPTREWGIPYPTTPGKFQICSQP